VADFVGDLIKRSRFFIPLHVNHLRDWFRRGFDTGRQRWFSSAVAAEVRLPSWSRTRETQTPQRNWGRGERSRVTGFKATFKAKPDS